jgi:HSP20 family protein
MLVLRRQPSDYWSNGWGWFQDEMNRLFERFDRGDGSQARLAAAYPPVNLWENADNVYLEAELPGMALDNLEIYVTEGNQLLLKGERRPQEAEKAVWHRQERGFGTFERRIPLPVAVEPDKVAARFENGVLNITLPKTAKAKPRRIQVKAE